MRTRARLAPAADDRVRADTYPCSGQHVAWYLERVPGWLPAVNRSAIVRQALREWLHRHAVGSFERECIAALARKPDEASRAEAWRDLQAWGEK